jgi:hypothetical protein
VMEEPVQEADGRCLLGQESPPVLRGSSRRSARGAVGPASLGIERKSILSCKRASPLPPFGRHSLRATCAFSVRPQPRLERPAKARISSPRPRIPPCSWFRVVGYSARPSPEVRRTRARCCRGLEMTMPSRKVRPQCHRWGCRARSGGFPTLLTHRGWHSRKPDDRDPAGAR